MSGKGKERVNTDGVVGGFTEVVPADQLGKDIKFIRAVQGNLPTVFPNGGREAFEKLIRSVSFGTNTTFINAELAEIVRRRMEEHDCAMVHIAVNYYEAYNACCKYIGRHDSARQLTSEYSLGKFRDAVVAASNEWFFDGKGHMFVDNNEIVFEPHTMQFAKKIYTGGDALPEDMRVALLRMIAMFIIEEYERQSRIAFG